MIRLLVGLGNPGPEYEATRHNAGFWWLDAAAGVLGARLQPERSHFGLAGRVDRPEGALWLLKPMTYMNVSGKSVASLARFFKIAPAEVLVVHDELDLLPGQARLKLGGSHAGHNGLKDIDAQLGSRDYWRLRLGIGHPGDRGEVVNWVLKKPSPDHRAAMDQAIERSLGVLPQLLEGAMERASAGLNARPPAPPRPPRPPRAPAPEAVPPAGAAPPEAGGD